MWFFFIFDLTSYRLQSVNVKFFVLGCFVESLLIFIILFYHNFFDVFLEEAQEINI